MMTTFLFNRWKTKCSNLWSAFFA